MASERILGNYRILEKLGHGAMGVVYKAEQITMQRIVALKVLPRSLARDAEFVQRFIREARLAGKCSHPNLVQGIDAGSADGLYYFAMEYVGGLTLGALLESRGPLDEPTAVSYMIHLARGLREAHEKGIIHRDVKPENIILDEQGTPKLADLGLARPTGADSNITATGMTIGTPNYMSPEQVHGNTLDGRADLYGLGATFFHLLSGEPLFDGNAPGAVMVKHSTEPARPLRQLRPDVSHDLEAVLAKLLEKRPAKRYANAKALIEDLDRLQAGRSLRHARTGRGTSIRQRPGQRSSGQVDAAHRTGAGTKRTASYLIAAVLAVLGFVAGTLMLRGPSKELRAARRLQQLIERNEAAGQLQSALDKARTLAKMPATESEIRTLRAWARRHMAQIEPKIGIELADQIQEQLAGQALTDKEALEKIRGTLDNLAAQYGTYKTVGERIGKLRRQIDRLIAGTEAVGRRPDTPPVTAKTTFQRFVNFQMDTNDPGVFEGNPYVPDDGSLFGDRGNGFRYGWIGQANTAARNRDDPNSPDERYDAFHHMQNSVGDDPKTWEIEVPNGSYQIRLVMGDPKNADSINNLNIEGTVVNDPDGADSFDEYNLRVTVSDGRLTVAATDGYAKICFIALKPSRVGVATKTTRPPVRVSAGPLKSLFNSRNLNGWKVQSPRWEVVNGSLVGWGQGANARIRRDDLPAAFELRFTAKTSGTFHVGLGGKLTSKGGNFLYREAGGMLRLNLYRGKDMPKVELGQVAGKAPDGRHAYRILVIGTSVDVYVDGRYALGTKNAADDSDFRSLSFTAGSASKVELRAIRYRDLAGTRTDGARDLSVSLFNGTDLSGWSVSRPEWSVKRGALVGRGGKVSARLDRYQVLTPDFDLAFTVVSGEGFHIGIGGENFVHFRLNGKLELSEYRENHEPNTRVLTSTTLTGIGGKSRAFRVVVRGTSIRVFADERLAMETNEGTANRRKRDLSITVWPGKTIRLRDIRFTE